MATYKRLDDNGLLYFTQRIASKISDKVVTDLIVTFTFSNSTWSADKTYADIVNNVAKGGSPIAKYSNSYYPLDTLNSTTALFAKQSRTQFVQFSVKSDGTVAYSVNNLRQLPSGGTQGQYLVKQSSASGDASWNDATFGGITKQVTLTQASWNNSQYVITDSLITTSSVQLIGIDSSATDSQREAYANAQIFADDSQQTVGSLVLVAKGDVPSLDIPIKILYQTQVAPITQVDINSIYPIGSIYMSVNNVNPSNLFGGTWVQLKDRFLLGAGDTYTAGATGGESEHTLTTNELPAGVLGINSTNPNFLKELNGMSQGTGFGWLGRNHTSTPTPVNNMPPYLVVYMWQRTA